MNHFYKYKTAFDSYFFQSLYNGWLVISFFFPFFYMYLPSRHGAAKRLVWCVLGVPFADGGKYFVLLNLSCLPFSRVVSLLLYFCAHFSRFFPWHSDSPRRPRKCAVKCKAWHIPGHDLENHNYQWKTTTNISGKKKKKSGNVFFDR